jgi:enolase
MRRKSRSALAILTRAVEAIGLRPGDDVAFALDAASNGLLWGGVMITMSFPLQSVEKGEVGALAKADGALLHSAASVGP